MSKRLIEYLILFSFLANSVGGHPPELPRDIVISFAGDCGLASNLGANTGNTFGAYALNNDPSYFLENVRDIFAADDFTMVNLENVFSDSKLSPRGKPGDASTNFWFIAPTVNAKILSFSGVDGVTIANNHSGDYGDTGREDTIAAVVYEGMEYGSDNKTLYFKKYGFTIAIICQWIWEGSDTINTAHDRLEQAKKDSDFQIMYLHCGTEGTERVDEWRIKAFRKMVDLGADLVINSGPHAIQPIENYNGVQIVYSLGNFCFGGNRYSRKLTMIYQIKLVLKGGKLFTKSSNVIPCYVYEGASSDFRPVPIEDKTDKDKVYEIVRRDPFSKNVS